MPSPPPPPPPSISSPPGIVVPFHPKQHAHLTPYLAALHASCITHDRTMATFLPPLSHEKLLTWWKERIAEVNDGKRHIWMLASEVEAGTGAIKGTCIMGVVMLVTVYSETGAFRAYVEKLLVHRNFRGRGGARALMEVLEGEAFSMGRSMLLLHAESDSIAETVCKKLGYLESGRVPAYGMIDPVLSCSCRATPEKADDTCCTETYGGLLVATQLWSTFTGLETEGQVYAKNSWSIHGLWPGSYTQYCDLSRQYDPKPSPNTTGGHAVPPYTGEPIDSWFVPHGKLHLLAYMNRYWVSQHDPNWVFWAHEFSKHATCFSTFQTECFGPNSTPHQDVFDFFETVIAWHKKLPTFNWLRDAGIRPSNTTAYTYADIQAALTKGLGGHTTAFVGCGGPRFNETDRGRGSADGGRTELNEVWYYYHAWGRPQDVKGRRVDAGRTGGRVTTCAEVEGAVRYFERSQGSER
ncbi:hypothetical protein E4U21_001366 [Claviceps maximensis]|nr:hypothetical protein E4U21_001366 [Claviceps maximensis]